MESIRILQDTYEKLYALTEPVANLLEGKLTKVSDWKQKCVETLSRRKCTVKEWKYFIELDLYYLLVLLEAEWEELERGTDSDFFINENNKRRFVSSWEYSIKSIRNNVSHPENSDYNLATYRKWVESIKKAAKALGENLDDLIEKLHQEEKDRLLTIIKSNVIEPALKCDEIDENTKERIQNTLARLEVQNTAAGIMYFFEDALRARGGIQIKDILHAHKLTAFEDIKDEISNAYYGVLPGIKVKSQ